MKTLIYNAYTGEVYYLPNYQLKNILEGEIPLQRKPNTSCKACFGRGYVGYDSSKKIYELCPKCVVKNVHPDYTRSIVFNYINLTNNGIKQ
jgi:hypothetical protein